MSQLTPITKSTINLPILSNPHGVAEVISANLDGMAAAFPRIKFPSGGLLAFEVPGDEGPDVAKELVGVIVDQMNTNTYWSQKFTGENQAPDCFSADGKVGRRNPEAKLPWKTDTMECSMCPFNQYGSDASGQGKACKNNKKIYMVREGEILPLEITIPPSSLGAFQTYVVQLTSKVRPIDGVVTRIKLKKATSKGGIEYSQAVFTKAADLSPEETAAIRSYARSMKSIIRQQAPVDVEPSTPISRPTEIEDVELPF